MRNWFRTCSLFSPEISISTFYTLGFPIFIRGIDYTINRSGYSLVVVAGFSCAFAFRAIPQDYPIFYLFTIL
nr:MAG TPA: hypothetical protein [Caudoviricetes sp.]